MSLLEEDTVPVLGDRLPEFLLVGMVLDIDQVEDKPQVPGDMDQVVGDIVVQGQGEGTEQEGTRHHEVEDGMVEVVGFVQVEVETFCSSYVCLNKNKHKTQQSISS